MKLMDQASLGKFSIVGAANTILGLVVIYLCKLLFSMDDAAANAIGYSLGLVLSFLLNKKWTFRYRHASCYTFLRFAIVVLAGYGINLMLVLAGIRLVHLNSYVAQAIGVAPYAAFVYLGCKHWVFVPLPGRHAWRVGGRG